MIKPRPVIAIAGSGQLKRAIATRLVHQAKVVDAARVTALDCELLIEVSDAWPKSSSSPGWGKVPALTVSTQLGYVNIGPLVIPGSPGCGTCAMLREDRARENREEFEMVVSKNEADLTEDPSPWLTTFSCESVATVVSAEILALFNGSTLRTRNAIVRVSLADATLQRHSFLPDPLCANCGQLPPDTAAGARLTVRARAKTSPGSLRAWSVLNQRDQLVARFVDPVSGLISKVQTGDEGGLPVARAPLGMRGTAATESGWGRTDTYQASVVTAVLEAVERWGGLQPGGRRTTVRAPYSDVADHAIDPRELGLYPPQYYEEPDFPFSKFDADRPMRWVWAHSFARGEPVLLPESYGYYGSHVVHRDEPRLAYEISNGCALGSCVEEAALHGLLEVAERDAFLIAWFARRPLPRIDLCSASDPALRMLAAFLEEESDRTITLFDSTVEQGIPCVWAIGVNQREDGRAKAVCAAGSHLNPEKAAYSALCELGPILASVDRSYQQHRKRVASMLIDSSHVLSMPDHSLLYADPGAFSRLEYLFETQVTRDFRGMAKCSVEISHDVGIDLLSTVDRYLASGLDVLVLNQTTTEQRDAGLSCVKAVVPGCMPMTFGHRFRRIYGLPRLFAVPAQLGDPNPPKYLSDLNPFPHPFP